MMEGSRWGEERENSQLVEFHTQVRQTETNRTKRNIKNRISK